MLFVVKLSCFVSYIEPEVDRECYDDDEEDERKESV